MDDGNWNARDDYDDYDIMIMIMILTMLMMMCMMSIMQMIAIITRSTFNYRLVRYSKRQQNVWKNSPALSS